MGLSHAQVLGASGRPLVALGGDVAWRQYVKGDVIISLQWIDLTGHGGTRREPEPCMALFAASRRVDVGSFVIPQSQAHHYVDNKGNPTEHLVRGALKAAMTLGFMENKMAAHRIMDGIIEALPDLLRMPSYVPPDAQAEKPVYGIELTAKVNGREVAHKVV